MSLRTMISFTKMKKAYDWQKQDWEQRFFLDWTTDERSRIGSM